MKAENLYEIQTGFVLGVIQQLHGPIFAQFWPPPPLEWTSVDILHTPSPVHVGKRGKKSPPIKYSNKFNVM